MKLDNRFLKKLNKSQWTFIGMLVKYLFAMILPTVVTVRMGKTGYLVMAAYEVLLIAVTADLVSRINRVAAGIISGVLLVVLEVQYAILYFGSTFLSMSMLDNLASWQDISGKFYIYIPLAVLVIAINCLPVRKVLLPMPKFFRRSGMAEQEAWTIKSMISLAVFLIPVLVFLWTSGTVEQRSPYYALAEVMEQKREVDALRAEIKAKMEAKEAASDDETEEEPAGPDGKTESIQNTILELSTNEFFRPEITDYTSKPENLAEQPNIILVLSEGTSQCMPEDSRDLMPNLRKLESESLYFDNYFNHTFATYMGISGQLHSGYQQDNLDPNVLISLQDILHVNGYETIMINTEPENKEFSSFLADFDFDELLTSDVLHGRVDSISDKDAYNMIFDTAMEKHDSKKPFFLCIYTFGTHVNTDSPDEVFEDGKYPTLNRAYNLDMWLGEFMEKFNRSKLAEDTLFILTADHAAYMDSDYINAFPVRTGHACCNEIPLVFYYKGMTPQVVDAAGRNTLDLAPTILDYLDITSGNCFLGDSLFAPLGDKGVPEGLYDTTFYSVGTYFSTRGGYTGNLDAANAQTFETQLKKYLTLKLTGEIE